MVIWETTPTLINSRNFTQKGRWTIKSNRWTKSGKILAWQDQSTIQLPGGQHRIEGKRGPDAEILKQKNRPVLPRHKGGVPVTQAPTGRGIERRVETAGQARKHPAYPKHSHRSHPRAHLRLPSQLRSAGNTRYPRQHLLQKNRSPLKHQPPRSPEQYLGNALARGRGGGSILVQNVGREKEMIFQHNI